MADVITGSTQLDPTKMEIIAEMVQRELAFNAKLFPFITDFSFLAGKGAKSVSFPKLTSFTVTNRASGAAGDASALTSSVDTMLLDKNAYVAWLVDSSDEVQSRIDVQAEFAKRAAAAHGRYVDSQIITELDLVAGLNINAGVPADITRDNILDMREFIAKNDGKLESTVLVIPPEQEKAMLKISEFSNADVYGQAVIPSGMIGRVYGIPVIIHNGLGDAQQAYMFEKEGMSIAFQKAPNMSAQMANEYGSNAVRYAMDQLFGVKGLQLGEKGLGATVSPLVAKLKD